MKFRLITRTLVYECAVSSEESGEPESSDSDGWELASAGGIQSAFHGDLTRARRFHMYLERKHTGLLLVRGGKWMAYGWISKPGVSSPGHLPKWIGALDAWWIFGCHTHESFRRQGIYKQLLARLITSARIKGTAKQIYIDTHADNIPSRRAILGSGFRPCGIFSTYRMWTPMAGMQVVGGRWRIEQPHPALPERPVGIPVPAIASEMSYKNYAG